MILLIDNYDSFSYNLFQLVGVMEPDIRVILNDEYTPEEIGEMGPSHIILSPGPGHPRDAGVCESVVSFLAGRVPILGICLGHQAICEAYGGEIVHAPQLMHGKRSSIRVSTESPVFKGLSGNIDAARYHSLVAQPESVPEALTVTATGPEGEIMAVEDRDNGVYGLQFHPESILTPLGDIILRNFLAIKGAA